MSFDGIFWARNPGSGRGALALQVHHKGELHAEYVWSTISTEKSMRVSMYGICNISCNIPCGLRVVVVGCSKAMKHGREGTIVACPSI